MLVPLYTTPLYLLPLRKGRMTSTQPHQMSEWKDSWHELLFVRSVYVFRSVSFTQLKFTLAKHPFLCLVFGLCSESCRRLTKSTRRLSEICANLGSLRGALEAFAILEGYAPYVDSAFPAFRGGLWVPKRRESAINITSQKNEDLS